MAPQAPDAEARAVLLLHGQPGSSADWRFVTAALARMDGLAPVTVLAIDRPGWGLKSPPPAGDLRANAAAALAALDRAGARRAVVVGHSFGGAVAAWLAAHHAERVAGLVLVAPAANAASLGPVDRWLALPVAGYLSSTSLMAGVGVTLAAAPARHLIAGSLKLDTRFLDNVGRALRSPAVWQAFAREQRALVRDVPVLEATLGAITAPTTVVIGDQDRVVSPASARALQRQIPGAELVVLPRAGHLIPFQRAPELAGIVARLLTPRGRRAARHADVAK